MSQFKKFNASENNNWDSWRAYPQGTLTWDPDNGLRIHDGSTNGGNSIGGFSGNFYDLTNRPSGNTAIHDLQGGSSSLLNGYFLKQISTGVSEWSALPTTYDTLTIDTKVIGGIDGAAGTQITGINCDTQGSGAPYKYVFLGGNDAFGNLFNRGSSIVGWKMYPASDPSAFVTITEFLENSLGGPSLGFSGPLQSGPWIAESSDYNAGTPGPLVLSADTLNWTLGTDGYLSLPAGGSISDYDAGQGSTSIGSSLTGTGYSQIYWDGAPGTGNPFNGSDLFSWMYVDEQGITLGYTNADQDKDYEWKFNTDGNLTLPANGNILNSNGDLLIPDQFLNSSNSPSFAGLTIGGSDGNEGGEIKLSLPQTNTTLSNNVSIDVYQNKLRIFENGGSARGVYIDLSTAGNDVSTNLLGSSFSGSYNDLTNKPTLFSGSYNDLSNKPTIPTDVSNLTDSTGLLPAAQVRYVMKNANFTAEAGKIYWLDSGTTARTVTLPANPTAGDWVKIYDGSLNWQTYNLTVNGNGNNIRTINMGGGMSWGSPASTATLNQQMISPVGPFPASFIWNGSVWSGAM